MPTNKATLIAPITEEFDRYINTYMLTYPNRYPTRQALIRACVAAQLDYSGIMHYSSTPSQPNEVRTRESNWTGD